MRAVQSPLPSPLLRRVERPDASQQAVGSRVEVGRHPCNLVPKCNWLAGNVVDAKHGLTIQVFSMQRHRDLTGDNTFV
jgi:hypothetical protein